MKHIKIILKSLSFRLKLGIIALITCVQIAASSVQTFDIQELFRYLKVPSTQAFLDTIAYSEGTFDNIRLAPKQNLNNGVGMGYNIQYTYKEFDTFDDHPHEVICKEYKGKPLCSSAAGRYQFLGKTWDRIAPLIKAKDFSPVNQDLGALALIAEKGALDLIPIIKSRKDLAVAIQKVNGVWASLPGAPYGQAIRPITDLELKFKERLKYHKKHTADLHKKYRMNNLLETPSTKEEDES